MMDKAFVALKRRPSRLIVGLLHYSVKREGVFHYILKYCCCPCDCLDYDSLAKPWTLWILEQGRVY